MSDQKEMNSPRFHHFDSMWDLQAQVENEGLEYFVLHYVAMENVRVNGEPLPQSVVDAAHSFEAAYEILNAWIGS